MPALMEQENSIILKEAFIKEKCWKGKNKDLELKNGLINQFIEGIFKMERNRDMVSIILLMALFIKGSFWEMSFMEEGLIIGKMGGFIWEIGSKVLWKEKGLIFGLIVRFIVGIL